MIDISILKFLPPSIESVIDLFNIPVPCFPPPLDWVMSYDLDGNPLSRYSDLLWDFKPFEKDAVFNFAKLKLSDENLAILKNTLFLMLYHPKLFSGKINSCRGRFGILKGFAKVCEKNGILLNDLSKFPRLYGDILKVLPKSRPQHHINFLHRLYLNTSSYGIQIINENLLKYLSENIEVIESKQRAYIPPRIYNYQLRRLNECIDDYVNNINSIKAAFEWISDAYTHNQKVKKVTNSSEFNDLLSPFYQPKILQNQRITYQDGFDAFLKERKLFDLFKKWLGISEGFHLRNFSRYLTLVRDASILFTLNFSIQRLNEACSMRSDCFLIEKDEKLGDIGLIVGETTKFEADDDARWIVPLYIKKSIEVASSIASLRSRFLGNISNKRLRKKKVASLPLTLAPLEPWLPSRGAKTLNNYGEPVSLVRYGHFMDHNAQVFDLKEMTITEEDFKITVAMTPAIAEDPRFQVGKIWPISAHQLRRTICVNMFSSQLVSNDSIQWAMKHISEIMTLYYARNYTNLKLNSEAESMVIVAGYKAMYTQLVNVVTDDINHVRPHGKELVSSKIINLVDAREEAKLTKLIKEGISGCRRTLLGFCMKSGPCEYGGIESASKCAINDGGGICIDAIFDKNNIPRLQKLKIEHERQLDTLDSGSPRWRALKLEIDAIGIHSNVCK